MKPAIVLRVLLAALAVALLAPPRAAPSPSADSAYTALAPQYFYSSFRSNPSVATGTGVHDYDGRLDDLSATHFANELAADESYLTKLDAMQAAALSPEVRIDRQMLISALKENMLIDGTQANWRHNPDLYTQVASNAVYALIARSFAPLTVRMQDVIARERQIPRLVAQAEHNITTVDAATAQVSYLDAAGSISFFQRDVPAAFAAVTDHVLQRQFSAANGQAVRAMRGYAAWIKKGPLAHPRGTFAIGRTAYQQRLLYDDALTMPVDEYLAVGERALHATQEQFVAVARQIDPHRTPAQVYATLSQQHPSASGLLAVAAQDITKLRAFVVVHHIIKLPPDSDITPVETPVFARSQIFAAFSPPGPLERVATQAYYYVTPPDPSWPKAEQDKALGFLNDYAFPIITTHEVMPGHFVNYAIDKHLQLSLTRRLLWNVEFGEGWAHYCEQMIVDEGWGNGDPRVRLAQLAAALTRESRYVVGVELHTRGMTVAQATQFFMHNAYMSRQTALREALRGTQDPMYGYYTLGKLMILKLRNDYQKKMGGAYTLEGFHDALLAHGDPPIPLLRPLLLGAADDGKPL
jgi:uncharacterized protein (DUF885 family)